MKLRKKRITIAICWVMLIFLSGCSELEVKVTVEEQASDKEEDVIALPDGTAVYPDGTMKLAVGSCSYGLYDTLGNLVQSGDTLPVKNDLISGTVSFRQNILKEKTEYLLMILVDYEKKCFSVGGQTYSDYSFTLAGEDSIDIDIELAFPENAKILTYLIVYEPQLTDLTFESEGREEFLATRNFYTISCYLSEYPYDETDYEFCDDLNAINYNSAGIFMTKDLAEEIVMPTCGSGEDIKILLGNTTDDEKTYVMLAFLDWEQSPIEGEPYKLFKLAANKSYYYNLTVPEVNEASPYQIFLLENPFHHFMGDWSLGTFRTIINTK